MNVNRYKKMNDQPSDPKLYQKLSTCNWGTEVLTRTQYSLSKSGFNLLTDRALFGIYLSIKSGLDDGCISYLTCVLGNVTKFTQSFDGSTELDPKKPKSGPKSPVIVGATQDLLSKVLVPGLTQFATEGQR